LFSASLNVRFSSLHLGAFVFERQIYFGGWIRKSSGLRPLCRKKKAHKLRWGMKAQKKSRQKEKAIPERVFKKRSLNLAEA